MTPVFRRQNPSLFFAALKNPILIFLEIKLVNTGFQPEKRTFSNSFTLKINFVHLENFFTRHFKTIFKVNEIYFQRTLFSDEARMNVNKCIFWGCELYYFYIWDSRLENGLRIAQMELR